MEIEKLKDAIRKYENSGSRYAKNIVTPSNITRKDIKYLSRIAEIPARETLLMAKYNKELFGCCLEGFIITDKAVYYKLRPNSFWAGLGINANKKGKVALSDVTNMGIGEHWESARGNSIGHEIVINGIVVGLLYMGNLLNICGNQGRADDVNVIFRGCGFDTSYKCECQEVVGKKTAIIYGCIVILLWAFIIILGVKELLEDIFG